MEAVKSFVIGKQILFPYLRLYSLLRLSSDGNWNFSLLSDVEAFIGPSFEEIDTFESQKVPATFFLSWYIVIPRSVIPTFEGIVSFAEIAIQFANA